MGSYMADDDISRYIQIYADEYGETISRSTAKFHLETLVDFVEMLLEPDQVVSINKNGDEYGKPAKSLQI